MAHKVDLMLVAVECKLAELGTAMMNDPKHAETAQHVEPVCRVHKQQYLIVSSSLELLLVVLLVALHLPIHQLRQVIIVGILLTFLGHKRHLRQVLLTSILLPSLG
jgi:hypothetical protein